MQRTPHFVNGLLVMIVALVGVAVVAASNFVSAAASVKQLAQPKIIALTATYRAAKKIPAKSVVWPRDAGKIIPLPKNATSIQLTPSIQKGLKQKVYWSFRYVWSDEAPAGGTIIPESKTIAERYFTEKNFTTRASSMVIPVDPSKRAGSILTVYVFVTNKDKIAAKNFPLGIDYVAAVSFSMPDANAATEEKPTAEKKPNPAAPMPANDDWSQLESTLPGYKQ